MVKEASATKLYQLGSSDHLAVEVVLVPPTVVITLARPSDAGYVSAKPLTTHIYGEIKIGPETSSN